MGLDIYGFLAKNVRETKDGELKTIDEYCEILDRRAAEKFHRFAQKTLKALAKAADDEAAYAEAYSKFIAGMKRFTRYEFTYSRMKDEAKPLDDVRKFMEDFEKRCYHESDVYFRKVNFVYGYLQDKLEDEQCFVDREDIEGLISRCDSVLADRSLAETLLPTTPGFFFGSLDYDNWYFHDVRDCRRQMKRLLKRYNEDTDVMYFVMSW